MKYVAVSSSEWTYPDIKEYKSAAAKIDLHSPRNSYATVQALFYDFNEPVQVSVKVAGKLKDLPLEVFELVPVHVEANGRLRTLEVENGCPNRWAPFDIYDCVKPLANIGGVGGDTGDGGDTGVGGETGVGVGVGACADAYTLAPKDGTVGLYFSFTVAADTAPGIYDGAVEVTVSGQAITIPAAIKVYKAVIPQDENIKIVNGYSHGKTAEYHKVELDSAENRRLDGEYLKMLRRMRQNTLYARGVKATRQADGSYTFDFSELESFIEEAMAMGYKYFRIPAIGGRESWKKPDINVGVGGVKIPSMSFEAYDYLKQYLKELNRFLTDKGWMDKVYMGVADEPNDENATTFRALCGMLRKLAPGIKLSDATSYGPIHGSLDCYIPLNSEYDKHMKEFESLRGEGDEMWHYVCCEPRYGGYINRFMDYPLLSTRYLFWGNYKYGLSGYLHWAANVYQPNQDPFKQNCPLHRNADSEGILPAGDTHIIYPGESAPWMSMRLEAHRMSAEDFELLRMISLKDKDKADKLCEAGFRTFNDVEYDIGKFERLKIELYEAASE